MQHVYLASAFTAHELVRRPGVVGLSVKHVQSTLEYLDRIRGLLLHPDAPLWLIVLELEPIEVSEEVPVESALAARLYAGAFLDQDHWYSVACVEPAELESWLTIDVGCEIYPLGILIDPFEADEIGDWYDCSGNVVRPRVLMPSSVTANSERDPSEVGGTRRFGPQLTFKSSPE